MAFITAAICYGVVMRYFFKSPSIWVVQTCEYALLWMVFLGATWLLREKGHVAVDIIYSHLRDRSRSFLNLVTFSMAGIACAVIVFFGTQYTWQTVIFGITDVRALTVPKYAVFIIIPFGSLLLCIQFFRMGWEGFRQIKTGKG
jgi:TRAP-type C4-dicarboxylate transport system permease small subunit